MRTEDEVRIDLDAAMAKSNRLHVALDTAKARYRGALEARQDLASIDTEALASGVSLDAESAAASVRELERRCKEAQDRVNELRQEYYQASTQPAIDAYHAAIEELLPDMAELAKRIEAAEALKVGVKAHDSRVFHAFRLRNELRFTAAAYERLRNRPPRRTSWKVWKEGDADKVTHIPAEEYERREQQRLQRQRPMRRTDGALAGWL